MLGRWQTSSPTWSSDSAPRATLRRWLRSKSLSASWRTSVAIRYASFLAMPPPSPAPSPLFSPPLSLVLHAPHDRLATHVALAHVKIILQECGQHTTLHDGPASNWMTIPHSADVCTQCLHTHCPTLPMCLCKSNNRHWNALNCSITAGQVRMHSPHTHTDYILQP